MIIPITGTETQMHTGRRCLWSRLGSTIKQPAHVVLAHGKAVVIDGCAAPAPDLERATEVERQCRPVVLHDGELEAA
jgi:hypothetical protein